jgi:WS/DGAT/MGAT family acyltransferase
MGHYKYDRLSAQDNGFLLWEKPNLPMHGGATSIFEVGSLATEDGGIDFPTIKRAIASILHKIPRYRQKLMWIPGEEHAVWVDDPHFKLDYHVRHTALPRPGSDAQLKQLAARITERPMDRARPLWEIWFVEGLEGGRFATVGRTHHCLVDGAGGMALAQSLFSASPEFSIHEPPRYVPRPHPSKGELRRDEWSRLLGLPLRAVGGLREFARGTEDIPGELVERARALARLAGYKVIPTSDTPLNGEVGPHRVFDWMKLPLEDIKAIRRACNCSVNDVLLAIFTGAIRDFMVRRQVRPESLEFRVATPVNVRQERDKGQPAGNHVSTWIVPLPMAESDPLRQIAAIHATTEELKKSHQATAVEMVEAIHEWVSIDFQAISVGTQNAYELKEIYIQAPLLENLGLTVGVISYNGKVCWGFTGDYDRIPDMGDLVKLSRRSVERLAEAAGVRLEGSAPVEVSEPRKAKAVKAGAAKPKKKRRSPKGGKAAGAKASRAAAAQDTAARNATPEAEGDEAGEALPPSPAQSG